MGGLIMTKGTRRLIAHYNDEFDTWIDWYRDPRHPLRTSKFDRAGGQIDIWNNIIQDPVFTDNDRDHSEHAQHLTLLPKVHNKHKNLHPRWQFFLQQSLSSNLNGKLADYIHSALTNPSVKRIVFDVVHQLQRDVTFDPTGNDDGERFAKITICTTAMLRTPATPGGHDPDTIDP